jgi:hypothetical protein
MEVEKEVTPKKTRKTKKTYLLANCAINELKQIYSTVSIRVRNKNATVSFVSDGRINTFVIDNEGWFQRESGDPIEVHRAITIVMHSIDPRVPIFD